MPLRQRVVFIILTVLVSSACGSSNSPPTSSTGGGGASSGNTQSGTGGAGGSAGDRTCRISNCTNAPPQAETAAQCQEVMASICGDIYRAYQACFLKPENDVCKADGTNNYGMQFAACQDQINALFNCVGSEISDAGIKL